MNCNYINVLNVLWNLFRNFFPIIFLKCFFCHIPMFGMLIAQLIVFPIFLIITKVIYIYMFLLTLHIILILPTQKAKSSFESNDF